jgi:diguanylate cyclase
VLFLTPIHEPLRVIQSLLIALLAAAVCLALARRVRSADSQLAQRWSVGGALVLGSGLWAMHFVGLNALKLPIEIGFAAGATFVSWLAALAAAAIALQTAALPRVSPARLAGAALALAGSLMAMLYTGIAAIDLVPGFVWNAPRVLLSAALAVGSAFALLAACADLRSLPEAGAWRRRVPAALVVGALWAAMHHAAVAAAQVEVGSICLSADELGGRMLSALVALGAVALLTATLALGALDARLRAHAADLGAALQETKAELIAAHNKLRSFAFRDPLTGLPNRLLFEDRLTHAVARVDRQRGERRLAVMYIDLDGFKSVNDSLGHALGDDVLREAAARLRAMARDSDTIARVGGDDFLLLAEEAAGAADCRALAARIVDRLGEPFHIGGRRFSMSASVGIVLYPDGGRADKLLAQADVAMHAAKRAGGTGYALFESHMLAAGPDVLHLQNDLRQALERGELKLHYQPKVAAHGGAVSGVEALLRWTHAERGPISPAVFIPLAERFGLIGALGDWVIEEACRQMATWKADGLRVRVAINLSVHQLRQEGLAARITSALRRHGVAPADLLCEITESVAMEDLCNSLPVFDELLKAGLYLSIDDFGTGYSSLAYLRRLPARQLKIDRSFINDLETSADARALVQAVVGLAHALGLKVVAEGVETAGQQAILTRLGCDELQGYLFAKPMAPEALGGWLASLPQPSPTHETEAAVAS